MIMSVKFLNGTYFSLQVLVQGHGCFFSVREKTTQTSLTCLILVTSYFKGFGSLGQSVPLWYWLN